MLILLTGCSLFNETPMRRVRSCLRHRGSLVVVCGFSSCGTGGHLPHSTWGPSSPTRDHTHTPCIVWQILSHWATREGPRRVWFLILRPQSRLWMRGLSGAGPTAADHIPWLRSGFISLCWPVSGGSGSCHPSSKNCGCTIAGVTLIVYAALWRALSFLPV